MAASYPRTFCLLFLSWVIAGLSVGVAHAQTAAPDSVSTDTTTVEWHVQLPQLTVTASRIPTSPVRAPARITVIDSASLRSAGESSVADVLEGHPGLFVRRYGTEGLATPALRGTGASQTLVLLDGQRMTNPQIGHLDLSLLPTVLLRSVQVMHGPASPIHGSGGLGGAIQLQTVQPTRAVQARLGLEAGAYGRRGSSLLVGGPLGPASSLVVAADYQSSDGDFPYTDASRFPPQTVRRRNADRTRRSLYASFRTHRDDHDLQVSGWYMRSERGLPPLSSTGTASERQWDTQLRLWAHEQRPLGAGQLSVKGSLQQLDLRYQNRAQDVDQTGRTGLVSLETTLRHPVTAQWTLAGGVSGDVARARHPQLAESAHQYHLSVFAEGTGHVGPLHLFPAVRADSYWMPGGPAKRTVNPRLGINLKPLSSRPSVRVKAQVGRAFRVPTFNDRYWQPGGNPNLRPEQSWGGDVGVRVDRPSGHAEITTFGHWRRDQIVWRPTGRGYWAPTNVGRVRAYGVEASADGRWSVSPSVGLGTKVSYTFTDARNRSNPDAPSYDAPLRYVPRHQGTVNGTLRWGPAALSLDGRLTGARYVTSDGSQTLDPYVLLDAQLRIDHPIAGIQTTLTVRLQNSLNTTYRSVGGRPMPPRHLNVRLVLGL